LFISDNERGVIIGSLLKPLQAGPLTLANLANRLVMPPMATSKAGPDGKVNQAILDHYRKNLRVEQVGPDE